MISILFESQNRNIVNTIAETLKKNGYKVSFDSVSKVFDENVEALILVFSKKTNFSESIIKQYNFALENQIPIIPFFITKPEKTLFSSFFLNSHDWINAYDTSTSKASEDLVILLDEIFNTESNNLPVNTNKTDSKNSRNSKTTNQKSNQKYYIIAIVVIFIVIIGYLIKQNFSGVKENVTNTEQVIPIKNNSEKDIIGDWKLAKYEDNVPRAGNDLIEFQKTIMTLKSNFLLKFKEDGTFEKYGFAVPESGEWQYDPQNKIIYMWPPNSNGKDILKVEKLTQDTLIFSIASKVDSLNVISTRFTLFK